MSIAIHTYVGVGQSPELEPALTYAQRQIAETLKLRAEGLLGAPPTPKTPVDDREAWYSDRHCPGFEEYPMAPDESTFRAAKNGAMKEPVDLQKERLEKARKFCQDCPVLDKCLDYVLDPKTNPSGFAANMTVSQRVVEIRRRNRQSKEEQKAVTKGS